jgi:hypothetical protein
MTCQNCFAEETFDDPCICAWAEELKNAPDFAGSLASRLDDYVTVYPPMAR